MQWGHSIDAWTVRDVSEHLGLSECRVRELDAVLQPEIERTPRGYVRRRYNPARVIAYATRRADESTKHALVAADAESRPRDLLSAAGREGCDE